jgi:hypothetical protein
VVFEWLNAVLRAGISSVDRGEQTMRKMGSHVAALFGCLVLVVGCGGGVEEIERARSPESANGDQPAALEQTPMEELQSIPRDLKAQVAGLTKPIDDVQKVIDQIGSIPKRYGINAGDMIAMANATFQSGQVKLNVGADISADAKAEIETALKTLKNAVAGLKATPNKVAALTANLVAQATKVPVLVTKVTAKATVTASNPFASADAKANAQADIQNAKQAADEIMKLVSETQAKVTGIPAMATDALGKLTAALAGGDGRALASTDGASGGQSADGDPGTKGRPGAKPANKRGAPAWDGLGLSKSGAKRAGVQANAVANAAGPNQPAAGAVDAEPVQTPAEPLTDAVFLKGGATVRGKVVKQDPGTFVTVETADGFQHTFPWERVNEVTIVPRKKAK